MFFRMESSANSFPAINDRTKCGAEVAPSGVDLNQHQPPRRSPAVDDGGIGDASASASIATAAVAAVGGGCGDAASKDADADYAKTDQLTTTMTMTTSDVISKSTCSVKLRYALEKVNETNISKDELVKILEYAIKVLESNVPDDVVGCRSPAVEDDDEEEVFSKVETEVVPTEVRDWLALTFTRSNVNAMKHKAGESLPKFRSVAHAIRAGIVVDRMYRRVSSNVGLPLPAKISAQLKNLDLWSFDVFALNNVTDGHALKYIGHELFERHDLINKFKINVPTLENFLIRLEVGYSKYSNPYHNLLHGADVAQTVHQILTTSGLSMWLSDVEILSAVFAALIHDYEHTGTTNTFHINTRSDVALLYNDRSVLENLHLSSTFRLLKDEDCDLFSSMKTEEYRELRSIVIDVVLSTDMSCHFHQLKNMRNHLLTPDNLDKTASLSLIVHCADISHPSKEWSLHERWTGYLIEEFFQQGDREEKLGLTISPLCDRKNTLVAESQIGFIDFIVDPSMQVMGDMVDRLIETFQEKNNSSKDRNSTSAIDSPANDKTKAELSKDIVATKMDRQWHTCLVNNKRVWKERATSGWISPQQIATEMEKPAAEKCSMGAKSGTEEDRTTAGPEIPAGEQLLPPES